MELQGFGKLVLSEQVRKIYIFLRREQGYKNFKLVALIFFSCVEVNFFFSWVYEKQHILANFE